MNQAPKSWILPSALVGYIALSSVYVQTSAGGVPHELSTLQLAVICAAPLLTALGLNRVARAARAARLGTQLDAVRYAIIGSTLVLAASAADDGQPALLAADALGKGLLVVGALRSVAQVNAAPSILRNHPAAASRDALGVTTILWSTVTVVFLLRALLPDEFPLDPIGLNLTRLFATLGSLLLLGASVLRLQLLRGLQLGIFERAWSALAMTIAGAIVGSFAGFLVLFSPAQVSGWVLVGVATGVVFTMAWPDPTWVTRVVRGALVSLLLAMPTTLFLLFLSRRQEVTPQDLILLSCFLGIGIGLMTRRAARPLSPEGARWLNALEQALEAALHPQPDQAMREALSALRKAEPTSKLRPEIFRLDPPAILSVDIAGYLSEQVSEFPKGIVELAADEPARTLRRETLLAAQVRSPQVRPLVNWFEAHEAKTATVLMDESTPIGLLILPRGRRTSPLVMDEATLLFQLSRRLAGMLSVTSTLKRSGMRELEHQRAVESAVVRAEELNFRLNQKAHSDHVEAEARVNVLRNTGHSPAAQIAMLELEAHAQAPVVRLLTKVGIDPVPWAAHAHLARVSESRPLVVMDFRSSALQKLERSSLRSAESALARAHLGTLVLIHPGNLSVESQELLADELWQRAPNFLVACAQSFGTLAPRLEQQLTGPAVNLPTLKDRAEDLQALIINELSQLGQAHRGSPLGMERTALVEFIERDFEGNDDELRGLLAALVGHCSTDRITTSDLRAVLGSATSVEEEEFPIISADSNLPRRSRARTAPRTKRY